MATVMMKKRKERKASRPLECVLVLISVTGWNRSKCFFKMDAAVVLCDAPQERLKGQKVAQVLFLGPVMCLLIFCKLQCSTTARLCLGSRTSRVQGVPSAAGHCIQMPRLPLSEL